VDIGIAVVIAAMKKSSLVVLCEKEQPNRAAVTESKKDANMAPTFNADTVKEATEKNHPNTELGPRCLRAARIRITLNIPAMANAASLSVIAGEPMNTFSPIWDADQVKSIHSIESTITETTNLAIADGRRVFNKTEILAAIGASLSMAKRSVWPSGSVFTI
jgi:hypothetical protein